MRIPSGNITTRVPFVMRDIFTQERQSGLSSFTVYWHRNGSTPALIASPDITEEHSGTYTILANVGTTLDADFEEQTLVFEISHPGMEPVSREVEIYLPKITVNRTLSVESDGDLTKVNTLDGHTPQTGDAYAVVGHASYGNAPIKTALDTKATSAEVNAAVSGIALSNLTAERIVPGRTFRVGIEGNRADNIVTLNTWSTGTITLSADFDGGSDSIGLNPGTTIQTFDAVTITNIVTEEEVTTSNKQVQQSLTAVNFDVAAIEEAGRFTVLVEVTTSDSQHLTLKGTLVVEAVN